MTTGITSATTAPKPVTAAATEKTGVFGFFKSIFNKGAAVAPAPLTPERVTSAPVRQLNGNLEIYLLVCELSNICNKEESSALKSERYKLYQKLTRLLISHYSNQPNGAKKFWAEVMTENSQLYALFNNLMKKEFFATPETQGCLVNRGNYLYNEFTTKCLMGQVGEGIPSLRYILFKLLENQLKSGDKDEIFSAFSILSTLKLKDLETLAKEKLLSTLLDPKYSPKEAARMTREAFYDEFLNIEEVEKIAIALGQRVVAGPMAENLPIRALKELFHVLNRFLTHVWFEDKDQEIIDKILPIDDLITATVNKIAAANGPSVSTMKTKISVEHYAQELVPRVHQSYFYEQVVRRLEAAEHLESHKVETARLANEKTKTDTRAAKEAHTEKLAKADAEARAKANIEKIKKEAANEARAKAK